jgi:hypothetical protein
MSYENNNVVDYTVGGVFILIILYFACRACGCTRIFIDDEDNIANNIANNRRGVPNIIIPRIRIIERGRRLANLKCVDVSREILDDSEKGIDNIFENDTYQCPICCEGLLLNIVMTDCSHFFHKRCLQEWIMNASRTNLVCPICRYELVDG